MKLTTLVSWIYVIGLSGFTHPTQNAPVTKELSERPEARLEWPLKAGTFELWRSHGSPLLEHRGYHKGVDLETTAYQRVFASESGRVTFTRLEEGEFNESRRGSELVIQSESNPRRRILYTHLEPASIRFNVGDRVAKGEVIGNVADWTWDNHATAFPHHLHIEIGEQAIDLALSTAYREEVARLDPEREFMLLPDDQAPERVKIVDLVSPAGLSTRLEPGNQVEVGDIAYAIVETRDLRRHGRPAQPPMRIELRFEPMSGGQFISAVDLGEVDGDDLADWYEPARTATTGPFAFKLPVPSLPDGACDVSVTLRDRHRPSEVAKFRLQVSTSR